MNEPNLTTQRGIRDGQPTQSQPESQCESLGVHPRTEQNDDVVGSDVMRHVFRLGKKQSLL